MLDTQIQRYERRIAEEERLAREARTPEVAVAHHQMAMLYRGEMTIMRRKRAAIVGETLAELG